MKKQYNISYLLKVTCGIVLQGYVDMGLELDYFDKGILRTEEIIWTVN